MKEPSAPDVVWNAVLRIRTMASVTGPSLLWTLPDTTPGGSAGSDVGVTDSDVGVTGSGVGVVGSRVGVVGLDAGVDVAASVGDTAVGSVDVCNVVGSGVGCAESDPAAPEHPMAEMAIRTEINVVQCLFINSLIGF